MGSAKSLLTSKTLILFNKIKDLPYKMHVLILIVFGSVLATTASFGPRGSYLHPRRDGCSGQAIVVPDFRRGDVEKSSGEGFSRVFQIKANKKKDKAKTNYISIEGTCCWVIGNRHGETEELGLGESKIPKIAYISTLKTKKC